MFSSKVVYDMMVFTIYRLYEALNVKKQQKCQQIRPIWVTAVDHEPEIGRASCRERV